MTHGGIGSVLRLEKQAHYADVSHETEKNTHLTIVSSRLI